ncbi:hypothetical protein [Radicibacter daui]|uniref:hypothetical protein n=1 Tax=Radicibacter daui TaxID=3064829 RepID=UPI004046A9A3
MRLVALIVTGLFLLTRPADAQQIVPNPFAAVPCTAQQLTALTSLFTALDTAINLTNVQIGANKQAILTNSWAPYQTWFGSYAPGPWTEVTVNLNLLQVNFLSSPNYLTVTCAADATAAPFYTGDGGLELLAVRTNNWQAWLAPTFFAATPVQQQAMVLSAALDNLATLQASTRTTAEAQALTGFVAPPSTIGPSFAASSIANYTGFIAAVGAGP